MARRFVPNLSVGISIPEPSVAPVPERVVHHYALVFVDPSGGWLRLQKVEPFTPDALAALESLARSRFDVSTAMLVIVEVDFVPRDASDLREYLLCMYEGPALTFQPGRWRWLRGLHPGSRIRARRVGVA